MFLATEIQALILSNNMDGRLLVNCIDKKKFEKREKVMNILPRYLYNICY